MAMTLAASIQSVQPEGTASFRLRAEPSLFSTNPSPSSSRYPASASSFFAATASCVKPFSAMRALSSYCSHCGSRPVGEAGLTRSP